jgi:hypothetical protein
MIHYQPYASPCPVRYHLDSQLCSSVWPACSARPSCSTHLLVHLACSAQQWQGAKDRPSSLLCSVVARSQGSWLKEYPSTCVGHLVESIYCAIPQEFVILLPSIQSTLTPHILSATSFEQQAGEEHQTSWAKSKESTIEKENKTNTTII